MVVKGEATEKMQLSARYAMLLILSPGGDTLDVHHQLRWILKDSRGYVIDSGTLRNADALPGVTVVLVSLQNTT